MQESLSFESGLTTEHGAWRRALYIVTQGIIPFLCSDLLRIVLLVAFPSLSLWLLGALA